MAAARSTLLEGLEDISEEEQLRLLLEVSKYDTESPGSEAGAHLGATNMSVDSNSSAGAGIVNTNVGATNMSLESSFEDWIRTPAEQRLQLIMDANDAENKEETVDRRIDSIIGAAGNSTEENDIVNNTETVTNEANSDIYNSDNEDDDEEIKRVLEESKRATVISDEEKTNLAIELSKREARYNMTTLEEQLQEAEEQLKEAIKLSMEEMVMPNSTPTGDTQQNSSSVPPLVQRPSSSQDVPVGLKRPRQVYPSDSSSPRRPSQRQSRPVSINHDIQTVSSSSSASSSPGPGPIPPPSYDQATSEHSSSLTEEQQLELALRQSQEDHVKSMSEEDQIKFALELSRSESAQTLPPYTSWDQGTASNSQNTSRSRNTSGHSHLGARPRVLQPLPVTSNSSTNTHLGARPRQSQPMVAAMEVIDNLLSESSNQGINIPQTPGSPRLIVLDCANICYDYGKNEDFDTDGILIAIKWFQSRGHEHVFAVVPQSRKIKLLKEGRRKDVDLLETMHKSNLLIFTPCRRTDEKSWDSYDDRQMIEFAATKEGIVVTNDQFRDLLTYYNDYKPQNYQMYLEQIRKRTLGFSFWGNDFRPAPDPLGKHSRVPLEVFLKY